jgi:hypothetical protein
MRPQVVAFALLGGCLLLSCGGSSRLRCGEGTEERDGECVPERGENGGRGGAEAQGGKGGSFTTGGAPSGGAPSPQGGSAGITGTGGSGTPDPPDPPEPDPTPEEVEDARALCDLPEEGVVLVPDIETFESLLVGRWFRCSGAMFFGRESPGIRFNADHSWQFFEEGDDGGLSTGAGFDNFGTWSAQDTSSFNGPNSFQVDIVLSGAGTNFVMPIFATEPLKMRWSTMLGTIDFAFIGER